MKYNCKKLSVLFAAVMMFVLACPATVLAAAEEEAGTPAVYATFWSLIPPVVAIVLALITKEVISSLIIGILSGTLIYSCIVGANPIVGDGRLYLSTDGQPRGHQHHPISSTPGRAS